MTIKAAVKRFTPENWAWLHFKISLGLVWALVIRIYPPDAIILGLRGAVNAWTISIVSATVISIVGLFMSNYPRWSKIKVWSNIVELCGLLMLFFFGPGVYFTTQLATILQPPMPVPGQSFDPTQRYALLVFAYCMCAALVPRIIQVFRAFYLELSDPLKTTKISKRR